jgi:type IX secretion system PorP/SprF family membrane protein
MKNIGYYKYVISVIVVSVTVSLTTYAQQQLGSFLQYQQHPEQINTAYSLVSDQAKLYSVARRQWSGIDGAPLTMLAGGHFKTKNERSAFGASVLYDKIGPERYTEANAFYGYGIRVSEQDYIGGSVGLGVRFYNVRYALLEQSDQALNDDINEKVGSVNLSFLYYRPETFYFGISLPRLGTGEFKEVAVFRENYSAVGAYLFEVDEGLHVKANTWLSWMANRKVLANVSATAYFNRRVGIGLNYGTSKDIGCIVSFMLQDKLRVGYGYQFGIASTQMAGMRNGTHEISLSYHFSNLLKPNLL